MYLDRTLVKKIKNCLSEADRELFVLLINWFIISVVSLLLVLVIQHHPHYTFVVELVDYKGFLLQRLSENTIPGPHGCGMAH